MPPAQYKISSDSIWKPCGLPCVIWFSEQLPSEFHNIKSAFNFKSYVLRLLLQTSTCNTVEGRQPTFSPDHKAFIPNILFCAFYSSSSKCILETLSLSRVQNPFFSTELSLPHFLFVCKVFRSVFWSKMEQKERKLALTIVASGFTKQTPFCKHVSDAFAPPPPHTYTNIRQWWSFVDKTKPSMGDRGKCV